MAWRGDQLSGRMYRVPYLVYRVYCMYRVRAGHSALHALRVSPGVLSSKPVKL